MQSWIIPACRCNQSNPSTFWKSLHTFLQRKTESVFKMFISPLETDSKCIHSAVANLCINKKPQLLTMRLPIANSCTRWRCNFKKAFTGWGTGGFFRKPPRLSLLLVKTFRINLILAKSHSLDSSLNICLHTFWLEIFQNWFIWKKTYESLKRNVFTRDTVPFSSSIWLSAIFRKSFIKKIN